MATQLPPGARMATQLSPGARMATQLPPGVHMATQLPPGIGAAATQGLTCVLCPAHTREVRECHMCLCFPLGLQRLAYTRFSAKIY